MTVLVLRVVAVAVLHRLHVVVIMLLLFCIENFATFVAQLPQGSLIGMNTCMKVRLLVVIFILFLATSLCILFS